MAKAPKYRPMTRETMENVPPYETCEDYIVSKKEMEVIPKYPQFGETAQMDLVVEQDNLINNEVLLAAKRVEFIERRKNLQEQWADIAEKERTFRESFHHFNKFVRENMEKRERAIKKCGEDKVLKEKRMAELNVLYAKMKKLVATRKNLEVILKKHRIYEDYLNNVAKQSGAEFKTVDDIIDKYETLMDAKAKLAVKQEEGLLELESFTQKLARMSTECGLKILGLNNRLATLEESYKQINEKTLSKEHLVEKIKTAMIQNIMEISNVKSAIRNVYNHMCDRKNVPKTIDEEDYEQLMTFIKKSIQEILRAQQLMERAEKKLKRGVDSKVTKFTV